MIILPFALKEKQTKNRLFFIFVYDLECNKIYSYPSVRQLWEMSSSTCINETDTEVYHIDIAESGIKHQKINQSINCLIARITQLFNVSIQVR
jgi:hypothetical protein